MPRVEELAGVPLWKLLLLLLYYVHLQHFEDFDTFSALWVIGVFP